MFALEKSSPPVLPPDYHHPMGASQLKRIFKCSGSVEACKNIKQEPGERAKFGSLVHECAYKIYQSIPVSNDYPYEIRKIADDYLLELGKLAYPIDTGVMEHRVFMPDLYYKGEQLTGTVDYAAVLPFEKLIVVDLKTGYEDVQPKDNPQLMFYAAACFYNLDDFSRASIPKIDLVIIQINDKIGSQVKTHTITERDLEEFIRDLKGLIFYVENQPTLTAGEHCHQTYCPARFTCPAYKKYVADNVGGEIIDLPASELSVPIDFARWLNIIPAIEDKIADIKKLALQAALDNLDLVPGWTVKQSFGHRKWEDEKEAELILKEVLGEKAFKKEILGPAPAEKLLGKEGKKCMPATVRPDLGYKLVKKGKDEIDDVDKFLEG